MAWLQKNRLTAVLIAVGAVLMIAIGFAVESTTAVMWYGGLIGVLIGGVIAMTQSRQSSSKGKRKK